jgi:hypothetical protein
VSVVVHPFASCCWCSRRLCQVDGIWWCPTPACAKRQIDHGIATKVTKGRDKGLVQLLYVPTPKQVEFDSCPAKYVLYGGAAGPGKSHAARWALYRRCLRLTNYRALLLRRTYPELESTHLDMMAQEAERIGAVFTKSERTMSFPQTGAVIRCGHMDDKDAVQKYLSTEYDVIVPDEGSTFDPDALLELSTRARTSKPQVLAEGGAKFWVASNPGGPASAVLLDLFIDHAPDPDKYPALATNFKVDDWTYIPATLDDNPYIDPAYMQQLATLPKWRYEQLRYGDWRVFSGQFFSQFQQRMHVQAMEPGTEVRWFRSMDWGRNQPGCVLWWAQLADHKLYIRKELKFQGNDEQEVAAKIKQIDEQLGLTKIAYTAADPAIFNKTGATHTNASYGFRGQSIGETLAFYDINVVKSDNDRFNGWGRCHALLREAPDTQPWLAIHPDCRYLIRSIAAAKSDDKDPDDVDTDTDDHALDAWRYGAMSRPHPSFAKKAPRTFAAGTMGALRQGVKALGRRLGSESVRVA